MTVDEAEQKLIMATLDAAGGNKTRAAEMLGISLKTLHNKLNRFKEAGAARASGAGQVHGGAESCIRRLPTGPDALAPDPDPLRRMMRLSLKQKQVLGVTAMVALVVTALSLLHLMNLARVLLHRKPARVELLANTVYHQARERGHRAGDRLQRAAAPAAACSRRSKPRIYSQDVVDAVDRRSGGHRDCVTAIRCRWARRWRRRARRSTT